MLTSAELRVCARSVAATHAVAGVLANVARSGDVIVLAGEMGAGKTAFAQGFGQALGVTEPITSPTFTLVHSYDTVTRGGRKLTLHHADVYRLDQLAEVTDLALGELAEFDGIVLVEWGDVVAATLGDFLEVRLDRVDDDDNARCLVIAPAPGGSAWAHRWTTITTAINALGLPAC